LRLRQDGGFWAFLGVRGENVGISLNCHLL
jgi:hypothetical protein